MINDPKNLYQLSPGTRYVVIEDVAVALDTLRGEVRGSVFYRAGENEGRMIRTRRHTAREILAENAIVCAQRPFVAAAALTLSQLQSDWK